MSVPAVIVPEVSLTVFYWPRRATTPIKLSNVRQSDTPGFFVGEDERGVTRHADYSRLSLENVPPPWLPTAD